jgi:hypothetical protein
VGVTTTGTAGEGYALGRLGGGLIGEKDTTEGGF